MAYLTGYTKRKKITISNTNVISDLTNFPVMVKFTSDSNIGAYARSDGYDIRFTSSDGTTLLDYERELFSVTSGSASGTFWVCVPTVASAAATDIYIYFGKSDASSDTSTRTFWDADYSNIYHFGEYGSGLNDSSNNGNHLTNHGLTISNGKASCAGLEYAVAAFQDTFSQNTTRMISALARTSGGVDRRTILAFSLHLDDFEPNLGHSLYGTDNYLSFEVGKAGRETGGLDSDVAITSSDIYHIVTIYKDTGEVDFYVNGIYKDSFTYLDSIIGQYEIQHIVFSTVPTKGQFMLTEMSGNMAYNDGTGVLASLLLGSVGSTNVTGNYSSGFDVEFTASYSDITLMSESSNSLAIDGSVSVVVNQEGDILNDEVQTITVGSGTGTFTVSWTGYGTTSALAHNISNTDFQTALDVIFGAGNTSVGGPGNGPWTITFSVALTLTDIPTPTFDVSSLNVPVTITITTTQVAISPATALDASGDALVIGGEIYEDAPMSFFEGDIYEARYSLVARSPSWIKFEAQNLLNGETTFSSLQTDGVVSVSFKPRTMVVC